MKAFHALSLAAFTVLGACRPSSPVIHEADGIRVTLNEVRNPERDYSTYQTRVSGGPIEVCWSSGPFGLSNREIRKDLGRVIAIDGYLFVPSSCGGGNASKCQGYQAFATSPKLHWLGNITGRWDGSNVIPYENGEFYDTGDMLESNDLLAHYESPRYAMAYQDLGGQLRFNAERTWTLNAPRYAEAPADSAAGLLYRAGLAKLCGKSAELRATQAAADKILNPKGRQLFKSSLAKVPTKNVQPSIFMPVGACPPAGKS